MKYQLINLDDYFEKTQKYYYFFDALFHKEDRRKMVIFKSLGISGSSYRTERLKPYVRNENKFILLNYFNYNKLTKQDNKNEYEVCLSKIYYCVYYMQRAELDKLKLQLEEYISRNNYLKPLFMLFKILICITYDKRMSEMKEELKEDLEYLSLFRNKYFTNKLKMIYRCLMYYFEYDTDSNELDNIALEHKDLLWLYYNLKGSRYYLDEKYSDALVYYQGALKEYKETLNVDRLLRTTVNIAYMYNTMDKYLFSLDTTSMAIEYVYSSKNDTWIKYITLHYLYSNYMLKRYKEIIDFYQVIVFDIKSLISTSAVICILAAYKEGMLSSVVDIMNEFKEDKNVKIICEYINTKNKEILNDLENIFYLVKIAKQLAR